MFRYRKIFFGMMLTGLALLCPSLAAAAAPGEDIRLSTPDAGQGIYIGRDPRSGDSYMRSVAPPQEEQYDRYYDGGIAVFPEVYPNWQQHNRPPIIYDPNRPAGPRPQPRFGPGSSYVPAGPERRDYAHRGNGHRGGGIYNHNQRRHDRYQGGPGPGFNAGPRPDRYGGGLYNHNERRHDRYQGGPGPGFDHGPRPEHYGDRRPDLGGHDDGRPGHDYRRDQDHWPQRNFIPPDQGRQNPARPEQGNYRERQPGPNYRPEPPQKNFQPAPPTGNRPESARPPIPAPRVNPPGGPRTPAPAPYVTPPRAPNTPAQPRIQNPATPEIRQFDMRNGRGLDYFLDLGRNPNKPTRPGL